jgi:two-component system sensor histidine kinase KdpD
MVCVSSRSPSAPKLLRKAARLADRLKAPWYAVYIQTPAERPERTDAATQRRVSESLALAQQLGGVPMALKAEDFAAAVADFAREYAVSVILVGRSRRPWYRRWFGRSPVDRLLTAVPDVDVLICGTQTGSHES